MGMRPLVGNRKVQVAVAIDISHGNAPADLWFVKPEFASQVPVASPLLAPRDHRL